LDLITAIGTFVYINLLLPVILELQSGELAGNRFPRDSITLNVSLVSQPVHYVLLEILIQVAAAAVVSGPASVTDLFRLEARKYLRDLLSHVRD
jgi:aromatic ring hydroxylase